MLQKVQLQFLVRLQLNGPIDFYQYLLFHFHQCISRDVQQLALFRGSLWPLVCPILTVPLKNRHPPNFQQWDTQRLVLIVSQSQHQKRYRLFLGWLFPPYLPTGELKQPLPCLQLIFFDWCSDRGQFYSPVKTDQMIAVIRVKAVQVNLFFS